MVAGSLTPAAAVIGGTAPSTAKPLAASRAPAATKATKAPVAPAVQKQLDQKQTADLWLVFEDRADLTRASATKDWDARGEAVVAALTQTADKSQAAARKLLKSERTRYTPYWASNRILVRAATEGLTQKLAELPGVEKVSATKTWKLEPPKKGTTEKQVDSVEWGLAAINADDVWNQFGVHGEGVTVANIDTGVEFDHSALVGKYRGNQGGGTFDHNYNWFDPAEACASPSTEPCDNNGHGSHTMGTMVGDDGAGNQVGVAPGARWIAAKGCESDSCSDESLLASGQWVLAPTDLAGENPRTDLRPQVVNNSWGSANGSEEDSWYDEIIADWTASGIFGVFSNGNAGSSCDTTGSPADSPLAYGVGAFDSAGAIADFSSRGPGADDLIRPSVSAPGVNVRSSVPGNGYANFDGTSMAAPHLSGTVALLWSAAPALIGDIDGTRALLDETAVDTSDLSCGGTAGDNNVWGEGKLDALAAVAGAPRGDVGVVAGTVTDAASGSPVGGAQVHVTGPLDRSTTTGPDGTYSLTLSVGDYSVTAAAYGYDDATASATVTKDATTTRDFALDAVPAHAVSGTVTDARGQPVPGVAVQVEGTPIPPATTGADGTYSFDSVPEGSYTLTATGSGCLASLSKDVVVDGAEVVDFSLADQTDEYGYRCSVAATEWVAGDTELPLPGDDVSAAVDLPFPVVFYGERYQQAFVSSNGHLSFKAESTSLENTELPTAGEPNAAVYPFWDDLVIDADAAVYTKVTGSAPQRGFVLEWRNALLYGTQLRVDAEVVLHETGDIVLAWRNLDPEQPEELGASATVGIENAAGDDALQYSFDAPVLTDGSAVRFTLPPNGFVTGKVTDKNDGNPVANATVTVQQGDTVVREVRTGSNGVYFAQVWVGSYSLSATATNYSTGTGNVDVAAGQTVSKDFVLKTARAEVEAPPLSWVLPQGSTQQATITLTNTGSARLTWEAVETGGGSVGARAAKASKALAAKADPDARNALGRYSKAERAKARPYAVGDVLASWPATGLAPAWGVGYNGSVWISDPETKRNHEFSTSGTPSGRVWDATWAGTWNGDMAYDSGRGQMCQVNVGGDNGIYCWDPATGSVGYHLTGSPWSGISQRGLAYRPDDDSFYVGGWNEDIVYHVAGASAAEPGAVLGQCAAPGMSIAGLAWNTTAQVLWVTTSTVTNNIHQINPDTCEVISSMGFPESDEGALAGAELDASGNLWATSQLSNTAYLLETGVPQSSDVPWLSERPAHGVLAVGASTDVTVTVDTTGLAPGVYRATLLLDTNAGRQRFVEVPVQVVVSGYWKGVDVGGTAYTDGAGLPWVADQAYRSGSYGWVGTSTVMTAPDNVDIADTEDDPLYRTQRQGMDAYRFDRLPAGSYEVTLDFAELARSPRVDWRRFDVDVNDEYVLVGYDIANAVGGRRADRRSFVVDLPEGGTLQVTFHDRRAYQPSVLNAVRVVHRPDL